MERRPDGQLALERAEGCLGLGQLHIPGPEFFGRASLQTGVSLQLVRSM
jgi:hypothetical protein